MANIFWSKRDTDNRIKALETTRGFLHRLKISWTLVHKRLRIRSESYPPFVNSALCFPRVARGNRTQPNVAKRQEINGADASRIRYRRVLNVNVTIKIGSVVSEALKHFKLAMALRRAAFSGNTSLIATFSSWFTTYNMALATLTIESNSKWCHCHLMYIPQRYICLLASCQVNLNEDRDFEWRQRQTLRY